MPTGAIKPYVGTAPILDETPASDDWGQLVRHIGPIDANIVSGTIDAAEVRPATTVVSTVAVSAVTVTLRAANTARRHLFIFNNSIRTLYVKLGSGATTSSWTVKLARDQFYELPYPCYTGIVTGIWSAADPGAYAQVTEATP